jgi:hypothetical protein
MYEEFAFIFLITLLVLILLYLALNHLKLGKLIGYYLVDEGDNGYIERGLSREFIEPLPKYEPTQYVPPSYTECTQIVCTSS